MDSPRRTLARTGGALVALATLFVALGPAAFAQLPPPEPAPGQPAPVIVQHGSPLWVFAVVVLVAIASTLGAQLLLAKGRAAHRHRFAHA